jgi:hypothetical protein
MRTRGCRDADVFLLNFVALFPVLTSVPVTGSKCRAQSARRIGLPLIVRVISGGGAVVFSLFYRANRKAVLSWRLGEEHVAVQNPVIHHNGPSILQAMPRTALLRLAAASTTRASSASAAARRLCPSSESDDGGERHAAARKDELLPPPRTPRPDERRLSRRGEHR